MAKRRAYTRSARKGLSQETREKLIEDYFGDAEITRVRGATVTSPVPTLADPVAEGIADDEFERLLDELAKEHETELETLPDEDTAPERASDREVTQESRASEQASVPSGALETLHGDASTPKQTIASQKSLKEAYEAVDVSAPQDAVDKWDELDFIPVDVPHLEQNLVITATRNQPAHGAFDVLRTRLVRTLLEHGWKRVAITSPTRNCGKTFTAVNLAISLSRYDSSRTVLLDFDMRNPSVAGIIGDTRPGKMGDFLRGKIAPEDLLIKFETNNLNIGSSLAIGTNDVIEPFAAELAADPETGRSLERMMDAMSPDIVIFDMPPALAFDDVMAFRPHFDGVLMVVAGGETRPEDVREVMRRLGEDVPLLGVVLNQAEGEDGSDYSYGY